MGYRGAGWRRMRSRAGATRAAGRVPHWSSSRWLRLTMAPPTDGPAPRWSCRTSSWSRHHAQQPMRSSSGDAALYVPRGPSALTVTTTLGCTPLGCMPLHLGPTAH